MDASGGLAGARTGRAQASQPLAADELVFDLSIDTVRELNQRLHDLAEPTRVLVRNPGGKHAIAAGLNAGHEVEIDGHVGYYCAGMNKHAHVRIIGNCATGVAENMMSGTVVVEGSASQSAGASAHGGLLVVRGNASARCGISLKGGEIVVCGSVGHMSAFMAQSGCLVVLGDAGAALGDSLYEARIYVRGEVASLGADCIEKEMRAEHLEQLRDLLERAEVEGVDPGEFRRYGSARRLYNFHVDNLGSY
jgi:glutamate synthase domain-containing protein 3